MLRVEGDGDETRPATGGGGEVTCPGRHVVFLVLRWTWSTRGDEHVACLRSFSGFLALPVPDQESISSKSYTKVSTKTKDFL